MTSHWPVKMYPDIEAHASALFPSVGDVIPPFTVGENPREILAHAFAYARYRQELCELAGWHNVAQAHVAVMKHLRAAYFALQAAELAEAGASEVYLDETTGLLKRWVEDAK